PDVILGQVTRTLHKPDFIGKLEEAKAQVVQMLAGPFGECLAYPELKPLLSHTEGDLFDGWSILRFATTPFTLQDGLPVFDLVEHNQNAPLIQQTMNEALVEVQHLEMNNVAAITRVAESLLARWELTAAEVAELCQAPSS